MLGSIQFNERLEDIKLFFEAVARMKERLDESDKRFKIILTELDQIKESLKELRDAQPKEP